MGRVGDLYHISLVQVEKKVTKIVMKPLQMLHNQSVNHLPGSWRLTQVYLSFEFKVNIYEIMSKSY
jgi:hypothetical protein